MQVTATLESISRLQTAADNDNIKRLSGKSLQLERTKSDWNEI